MVEILGLNVVRRLANPGWFTEKFRMEFDFPEVNKHIQRYNNESRSLAGIKY